MKRGSAEPVADGFLIRVHDKGGCLGDSYTWHCVAVPTDTPGVATLHLAPSAPSRAERQALAEVLKSLGIRKVMWERRKSGKSRWTKEFSGEGQ